MAVKVPPAEAARKAHELALEWWRSQASRDHGVCDRCSATILRDHGYLCKPAIIGMSGLPPEMFDSPDLVCESCFDETCQPWEGKGKLPGMAPPLTFPGARDILAPGKRWWQVWK
jgi:hypothetical protein